VCSTPSQTGRSPSNQPPPDPGRFRTPTACCASTSRKAPISRAGTVMTSTPSALPSTRARERRSTGELPQRLSTLLYNQLEEPVLRRLVEPKQYTSIAFTEALIEAGIAPSIGTVGDALDNALIGARRPAVAGQEQGSPRHHGPRPRHRSTAPANPRRHRSGPPRPCRSLGNHARSIRIGVRPGAGVNQLPRR
jgi:hypothetical protein